MHVPKSDAHRFLSAVREFADTVLACARDVHGAQPTPLLASYLNAGNHEPALLRSGRDPETAMVLSNLATQQTFLRTLDGLTKLTGESDYRDRALQISRYALQHLRRNGLLFWGGHTGFDLVGKRLMFMAHKGRQHELKCHFPYYDLMWDADAGATRDFIEAFWQGHIRDWSSLDFDRHGRLDVDSYSPGDNSWRREYGDGRVFFPGVGLTFINTGSDLLYAAAMLYHFSRDEAPLTWAKRLAHRYEETRNPETGMGGYQFSVFGGTGDTDERNDRADSQFREQFPEHHPLEGRLTDTIRMPVLLGRARLSWLQLGEDLGPPGEDFLGSAVRELHAYGKHAYESETNLFHPVFTDGFRLTGHVMEKDGYYGPAGRVFEPMPGDWLMFRTYAKGWRLSREPLLGLVAGSIARHRGLGEIGVEPGRPAALNEGASTADPNALLGLLELHRAQDREGYLRCAARVGDNILTRRLKNGLFVLDAEQHLSIDCLESIALLHLAAQLLGRTEDVPQFCPNPTERRLWKDWDAE